MNKPQPDPVEGHLDRVHQEMAKCAKEYDEAIKDLSAQHADMSKQEQLLLAGMKRLCPVVDKYLANPDDLQPGVARTLLRYQKMADELQQVRQARRLAYPATLPPGEARLGGAIGDPVKSETPVERF